MERATKLERKMIPVSMPSITQLEIDYVTSAVESTWVSSIGKFINEFEERFAAFCDARHAIAVSNGTTALHLAMEALGISRGDEVIVPDLTFVATANAVLHCGATPVFADVEPGSLSIDPRHIESLINDNTKAIIPVHLYGHPANMDEILRIARQHHLFVIEDAAEAHGAQYRGKTVGALGDMGTFSFYGNKCITTGEGGMITTNNDELNDKLRYLRDHAMSKSKRYWHTEVGYNYRMTNLQAALGCAQLTRIDEILQDRKRIFRDYAQALGSAEEIQLNHTEQWADNSYWLIYGIFTQINEQKRDDLMVRLREHGVDTRPFFYPMSVLPYLKTDADTPVARRISAQGICLPTYYGLSTEDIEYICATIKDQYAKL